MQPCLTRYTSTARDAALRPRIEVVAMDGFAGFKTAAAKELPKAVAVMDPFHVVRLGGDGLDQCRRRIQQELHGHRGLARDPLYMARRTLHTGDELLTLLREEPVYLCAVRKLFAPPPECPW